MEGRIHVLDIHTANRIAAGEVVDRPASVVKELVENAIDAQSSEISVEASGGGIDLLRVRDNGTGIAANDVQTAFARHATSKISTADDLSCINTLGFRGEALASIAAVARVCVRTKQKDAEMGTLLQINGGELESCSPTGCVDGTLMQVENLFYNTPARLKFLKSARTETAAISDFMSRVMMAYPGIAFALSQNGRSVYQSAGDGDLLGVICGIYGEDTREHLKKIEYDDGYVSLQGYAGTAQLARSNRLAQTFFINHRYIKSQKLSYALQRAYDTRLMGGKFPLIVLDIGISNREIDVNVHPNKMEVRFKDEERVTRAAYTAVKRALGIGDIPPMLQNDVKLAEREVWIPLDLSNSAQKTAAYTEQSCDSISQKLNEQHTKKRTLLREGAYTDSPQIPLIQIPPRTYTQNGKDEADFPAELKPSAVSSAFNEAAQQAETSRDTAEQLFFTDEPYTVVGQLFACYILLQQGDEAFFIDQHAAHERKLYEQMRKKELHSNVQILLSPQIVKLSPSEHETMLENIELFSQIGFDIEEFGALTISIRAVPYVLGSPQSADYLREVLDMLGKKNRYSTEEMKRDVIVRQACKRAIKAGKTLGETEIRALMDDYRAGGIPLTCPHGRPVMIKVSKTEMEKLFKRLV